MNPNNAELNETFEMIVYGCHCTAYAEKFHQEVFEFCPEHLIQKVLVVFNRRSINGFVSGITELPQHDRDCAVRVVAHEEGIRAYQEAFPSYCRHCRAWGGKSYYDSDTGDSGIDPCRCVEAGMCPRCGFQTMMDNYGEPVETCHACGFHLGVSEGIPETICICFHRHMDKLEEFGDLPDLGGEI